MAEEKFEEMKMNVEAILFSYGNWISVNEIMDILGIDSELLINNALRELQAKFKQGYSFFIQQNDAGHWKMRLAEDYVHLAEDVISGTEIPKKVLKVLSVIAYEQPVTKTRLLEIMGRSVKPEVDYLFNNKFLSYEKHGNGKYYKLTKKFYDYFDIDENSDFRERANKTMTTYIEEPVSQPEEDKENSDNTSIRE
ncbi:MAG: SMC-Scp complex subunit ScpB [Nanoarchaeota archaeon]